MGYSSSKVETAAENKDDWEEVELASIGQRFANFVLDMLFLSLFLSVFLSVMNFLGFEHMTQEFLRGIKANPSNELGPYLKSSSICFFVSLLYYFPQEWVSGRTLGKLLTGTQAINDDGRDLTLVRALLRSCFRWIPFEPFSFLFLTPLGKPRGWHDRFSKTLVITLRRTNPVNAGNNTASSRRQWQG